MSTINPNWYTSNSNRRYPLADTATGTGDDGTRIRDDIITDLHLRWPRVAGEYAYVTGITVTANIVTVVICAADSPTTVGTPTPLAAVTLTQPVKSDYQYALTPLYPGVGGFIALGNVLETMAIRFSTPVQGLICPKNARPYAALPIPSMRKQGRVDGLTGIVRISGGNNIEVVKDVVSYNNAPRDALVIRLRDPVGNENLLAQFIGPCGARPESRNCVRVGIETINGVAPNCDGNIELVFANMTAGPYDGCDRTAAGVTLDQDIALADACQTFGPGHFAGTDDCNSTDIDIAADMDLAGPVLTDLAVDDVVIAETIEPTPLPFTETFDATMHTNWILYRGTYTFVDTDAPATDEPDGDAESVPMPQALLLTDASQRQVLVWEDPGTGALNKTISTWLKLTNAAGQIGGGLILNYREIPLPDRSRTEYMLLQLNRNTNKIELLWYTGQGLVKIHAVSPSTPFSLHDWYEISATVRPADGQVGITATVSSLTNPAWVPTTFTVLTKRYGDPVGYHGVGTNRTITHFARWAIQDA